MVLRLNKSLKLAESIMSLYPHKTAQAQHQLSSLSTLNTPLVACEWHCQRRPFQLPQIVIPKDVHLGQLATWTYHITASWTPSSYMPEECNCAQLALMHWTLSAWWVQYLHRFSRILGCVLLPRTPWIPRGFTVLITTTSSAGEGNILRYQGSAERLHCHTMWMCRTGLPSDELTKQSLLLISNL
jgi:hypothetical protein